MKKYIYLVSLLALGACSIKNTGLNDGSRVSEISKFMKTCDNNDIKTTFILLPVNCLKQLESTQSRINLRIAITNQFVSVVLPENAPGIMMREFVPRSDTSLNNWSEMITIHSFVGKCISAHSVVEIIKTKLSVQVIESNSKKNKNYSESSVLASYIDKGRKVILYAVYYSGPCDCSGFQYAIVLNDGMTKNQAIKKIKETASKSLKLIKF